MRVTQPWRILGEFTNNSCAAKFFNVYSYIDTKAFSSKQLLAKFTPLEEVTQAVTDLVVLSASRKEDVPVGYRRLPYVYSKQYTPMLYCYIQREIKHIMKMIFFFPERSMGLASVSRSPCYLRRVPTPLPLVRVLFCETVCCTALCLVVECMSHWFQYLLSWF